MGGWEFYQKVDYEQLPFKCRKCHEYRHFVKNCPKSTQEEVEKNRKKAGIKQREEKKQTLPLPVTLEKDRKKPRSNLIKAKEPSSAINLMPSKLKKVKFPI